uniref:Uncharacterized protein n=1 Tax=Schistosoma haematobium TaxID=6185 RepID=A0A094ZV24_SCHHA
MTVLSFHYTSAYCFQNSNGRSSVAHLVEMVNESKPKRMTTDYGEINNRNMYSRKFVFWHSFDIFALDIVQDDNKYNSHPIPSDFMRKRIRLSANKNWDSLGPSSLSENHNL